MKGAHYRIIPDRIEAGTYMVAAAITGGNVEIKNVNPYYLKSCIVKLEEAGLNVDIDSEIAYISDPEGIKSVDIKTMPFPGFPTDMQAQFMALMTIANGTSIITENVFENRFAHAGDLRRMGADIKIEGRNSIIKGVKKLSAAPVMASDLRGGAALVLAALVAEGITEISRIYHIDRGYVKLEEKLKALGANIKRC
jgi:UDP-N-acetylglucosamine 1-carboxyvinyltransferase